MHPVHKTRRGGAGWFRVISFFAFIFHFRFLTFFIFNFFIISSFPSVFVLAMVVLEGSVPCAAGVPGGELNSSKCDDNR